MTYEQVIKNLLREVFHQHTISEDSGNYSIYLKADNLDICVNYSNTETLDFGYSLILQAIMREANHGAAAFQTPKEITERFTQ